MPTVRTLVEMLEATIRPQRAAGWDPVGLQVGDPDAEVERLAVCHDVTPAVAERADADGVGLLVSYHPLLFAPVRRFVAGPTPSGLAHRLARAGTALAIAHTAFDVAPGGTADALASALGIEEAVGFAPLWGPETVKVVTFVPPDAVEAVAAALGAAGAGRIGGYSGCSFRSQGVGTFVAGEGTDPVAGEVGVPAREEEVRLEMAAPARAVDHVVAALVAAHPYEEPAYDVYERRGESGFVGRVGVWSGTLGELRDVVVAATGGTVRVAGDMGRRLSRVAVVPGSGATAIDAARAAGAEAIVTGDVKHHDARAALAGGVAVIDPGHAASERPGVAKLYAAVAAGWSETFDYTGYDADPWTG